MEAQDDDTAGPGGGAARPGGGGRRGADAERPEGGGGGDARPRGGATGTEQPGGGAAHPGGGGGGGTKPAPPAPTRIITAPRRAQPTQQMWTRPAAKRDGVNFGIEFEKLSQSMTTIASGLTKVYTGFGLRIISQEEEKMATLEKNAAERMTTDEEIAAAKLSPANIEQHKEAAEEEKLRRKEEEKKERRIALLLSMPRHLVNISSVIDGMGEITCGSKSAAVSMGVMICGIPSLVKQIRGSGEGMVRGSTKYYNIGAGCLGLQLALDRQVVTRASDGRVLVIDAFGSRKESIPKALGGALIISNQQELKNAILDFKLGKLTQLIDIDENMVSFMMAHKMWISLCDQQLTGLLRPSSPLPEMALRASALIDENNAVKAKLQDAENAVKELQSCLNGLQDMLQRSRNGAFVQKGDKNKENFV